MTDLLLTTWTDVCALDELTRGRGVAALIGGEQVALFRWDDDTVFAVSNYDPFSRAYVVARGIVGSRGDAPKVSSPVYKQSFDLRTGACFDDADVRLATFPTRVVAGRIEVGSP